jgi:hypothetical protein
MAEAVASSAYGREVTNEQTKRYRPDWRHNFHTGRVQCGDPTVRGVLDLAGDLLRLTMDEQDDTEGGNLGVVVVSFLILLVTTVLAFGVYHVMLNVD